MKSLVKMAVQRLVVVLIRSTKYDRRGYPLRFFKGVLPSNSLAVMHSLTEWVLKNNPQLAEFQSEVYAFDDAIWRQRVNNPAALIKRLGGPNTKVVVGFVGVQTNQFPRTVDLALQFTALGAQVVIGGFHVSGIITALYDGLVLKGTKPIPCQHEMPAEIQNLMDKGIIICHGEAEAIWDQILCDIIIGKAKPLYRGGRPAIDNAPLPRYPVRYFDDFAIKDLLTIDTGRGCPFHCSFCTIIGVQGQDPRWRNPRAVINYVKETCDQLGHFLGFFTDDNFARNPYWETILDGLIALRQQGYEISFMVEADLASYNINGFVEKLALAGCSSVFLGMESVRPQTLKKTGKPQNLPTNYKRLCDKLHRHGIFIHVGYIIGFDDDTPESIAEDIQRVQALGVDQLSPFILTPMPGSEDYVRLVLAGGQIDPDYNKFDSFEVVSKHPNMTAEEWLEAFFRVFHQFYRPAHMIKSLQGCSTENQLGLLRNYIWYRNSALGEKVHPMECGFISCRSRHERRPSIPKESFLQFWANEIWHYLKYFFGHVPKEYYVFQHVWYEINFKPALAKLANQLAKSFGQAREDIEERIAIQLASPRLQGVTDWFKRTFSLPKRRGWLNAFWRQYGPAVWRVRGRSIWKHVAHVPVALLHPRNWGWHLRMLPRAVTEVVFTIHFLIQLIRNFSGMTYR